jgi:[ribosomal protein S5]-alanine N-acetyltransferase
VRSHAVSPTLHTSRLTLEPLVAAHAEMLFEGMSAPTLYTFIPHEPPRSIEALRARYERLEARASPDGTERWLNWAARLDGGAYVGLVEATVYPDGRASIAYFVFVPFAGNGYGAEGTACVVRHLVDDLGVRAVEAHIDTRNVASQRLVERVGFTRVGEIRDADHFKGASSDEYVYRWTPPV